MSAVARERLLNDVGVFVLIATFRLRREQDALAVLSPARATDEVARALARSPRLAVDMYLTRGLSAVSDYFVRIHAYDLAEAQSFLNEYGRTMFGGVSEVTQTLVGLVKERRYITAAKSAALNDDLDATPYRSETPRFAIVIPVKKTAEWWCLPEEVRLQQIETHTRASLSYLGKVKRNLYHSTGLDDLDFITYFETSDLAAFHDLAVSLAGISENLFHARWGNPVLLGTIRSVDEVIRLLCGTMRQLPA